ncbi:O-antigen/teichoic acid export membrane protein [Cricetibacter osteomyelitidis]|uniref:O-antigen/teichoic acid export membrane protein n=1 Tax=Cricetibacter osteomyelitidis TaxID=1521931 RepID=A0A4R2T0V3_9PAST|nr:oligosaccharide flippase family protein [Cricetibacter osteomyelitidis]TCP95525.1 O-antigen/teichoic acid export membrane protein [Cricetibacter osteomyelitidis]
MKVVKDSVIYLGGELFSKALPFLLLPYLTRKLGVEGFGEMSYYTAFLSFFTIIVGLSQDGAVARYYYFYGKRNLGTLVFSGYLYTALITLIGLLVAAYYQSLIFAVLILTSATSSMLAVQLSVRQCQKQAISYVKIQLATGILSALLTVIILELVNTELVLFRFIAMLATQCLIVIGAYYLFPNNAVIKIRWKKKQILLSLNYIFTFGLPLMLHHGSNTLKAQADKWLVYHQYSAESLGVYAAGFQIASIFSILIMAINKATVPYYFEALKQKRLNKNTILKWSLLSLFVAPIIFIISYLLPESLFLWLLDEQYIGVSYYISIFLVGFSLMIPYLLLVNNLFYLGKNGVVSISSLIATLVYIFSLIFLSGTGIENIPFALIIGNILILPILYYKIEKSEIKNERF